jgi:hypothetical protein
MFQKEVEKVKTHFMFSYLFFPYENRAVCEITWENVVEADRPQMAI